MNPSVKLTPELQQQILASIRAGGFEQIAAAAWGVPEWLWSRWKQWGYGEKARPQYKKFFQKVEQAKAQARLKAEMKAMDEDPRFWLKNGPGKDQPDSPGWSAMVRPMLTQNTQTINLFTSPDFLQFMATLRQVLAPYPEALTALSNALDSKPAEEVKEEPKLLPPIDAEFEAK